MQAGIDVAADFAKGISINVLNLDRDLFGLLGEGIEQTRACGWIFSHVAAIGCASSRFAAPSNRGCGFVQKRCIGYVGGRELMQRRDVRDPKASAMCCGDDFSVVGVEREVKDRNRGEVGVEFVPILAAVSACVDREFGSDQQYIFIERTFL